VPPGDVESLAGALNRVVSGEVDLEAMGQAASDEAQRTLDINTIGGVYDRVMAEAAVAAGTLQASSTATTAQAVDQ
jgi:hypothetical protein